MTGLLCLTDVSQITLQIQRRYGLGKRFAVMDGTTLCVKITLIINNTSLVKIHLQNRLLVRVLDPYLSNLQAEKYNEGKKEDFRH